MAKAIMIQGTMSNAGKSLIVTGLCRIFQQDGWRVAPFKSQNMALNSHITKDNLEMGRAQAVQAEACGIEPDVRMNPILLKPTTDMGSQVILNGEPVGNMHAVDYFRKKREYLPLIREAYESLAAENDIIVIEGAGSPAEINLKQDDIVNMGMAKLADAQVLLVGDIDRGGVFAQLYGTVQLLEKEERERICGLIINKFRGDRRILEPGISMLESLCQKKVLGVVPWTDVEIEEEDSLAESLNQRTAAGEIDIAVIRLPRISNFTDFQALSLEEGVSVRYVERPGELGRPDAVILPGTKNTIKDLKWLRQTGLEAAILRLAGGEEKEGNADPLIFGICGGYQMLGQRITDTEGVEGREGESIHGMGLLPASTMFEAEKTRTRVVGRTGFFSGSWGAVSDREVSGYEIHMGRTLLEDGAADFSGIRTQEAEENTGETRTDGCCLGNAAGTYLHGIFDGTPFREAFLDLLAQRKGIERRNASGFSYSAWKQQQYDRLADVLRESLDMKGIYEILQMERRERKMTQNVPGKESI